jgi:hypothetical protein
MVASAWRSSAMSGRGIGGTNTIAYCRDDGPAEILLRARHLRQPIRTEQRRHLPVLTP